MTKKIPLTKTASNTLCTIGPVFGEAAGKSDNPRRGKRRAGEEDKDRGRDTRFHGGDPAAMDHQRVAKLLDQQVDDRTGSVILALFFSADDRRHAAVQILGSRDFGTEFTGLALELQMVRIRVLRHVFPKHLAEFRDARFGQKTGA